MMIYNVNPLRIDPTRTTDIRKRFDNEIYKRFNTFKNLLDKALSENLFGFVVEEPTANYDPNQPRDEHGRFTSGGGGGSISPTATVATMYRGVGEGADTSSGFEWYSEQPELAKRYAEYRGGNVETHTIAYEKSFDVSNPRRVLDAHQFFADATEQVDVKAMSKDQKKSVLEARKKFLNHFGEDNREIVDYWSNPEAKETTRSLLESMSFDSIRMREGDDNTVAIFRKDQVVNVANARFKFDVSKAKLEAFQVWLKDQIERQVLEEVQSELDREVRREGSHAAKAIDGAVRWTDKYIAQVYERSVGRAFDSLAEIHREDNPQPLDFYAGTKEEFLRSSFRKPVSAERVNVLAERTYLDIVDTTESMAGRMRRVLVDGMIAGESPRKVAATLADEVDKSYGNALRIARTETIRAHNEGALDTYENLGLESVGVSVEWSTSGMGVTALGNPSPCDLCAPLEGMVLKISEARGMLPRHPNCMCSYIPAGVGEPTRGQARTQSRIQSRIDKSIEAEIPKSKLGKRSIDTQKRYSKWTGAGKRISTKRPKPII